MGDKLGCNRAHASVSICNKNQKEYGVIAKAPVALKTNYQNDLKKRRLEFKQHLYSVNNRDG
jgi:hypothetical protein